VFTKKINRRTFCAVGAAVVALAIIVTGAFAWYDNSQHKSNIATGGNKIARQDVVLIEDYEEPDDWFPDEELKKEVSVKNTGEGQVYIRLQLKEYMDIASVEYEYSDERLLVDTDGRFMSWNTKADAEAWLTSNGIPFTDAQLVSYTAYGETAAKIFFATDEHTPLNGRYGKFMMLDYTENAPTSLVPGVVRGTYEETDDHQEHPKSECLYTPHLWNGATPEGGKDTDPNKDPFHEYVEWNLGAPLIKLSAWDGKPVAAWILDDVSDDGQGWVYWGEPLKAGDDTTKLLESITLIKQPSGPFYYALHVDMQTADIYDLDAKFDNMPQKVKDSFHGKTGFVIGSNAISVTAPATVKFSASLDGVKLDNADVVWTVAAKSAASLAAGTNISGSGILTIASGQAKGTLTVTAASGGETAQYVITVK